MKLLLLAVAAACTLESGKCYCKEGLTWSTDKLSCIEESDAFDIEEKRLNEELN